VATGDDVEPSGPEAPLLIDRLRAICSSIEAGHAPPPRQATPTPITDAGLGQRWTLIDCWRLAGNLYLITRLDSSPLPTAAMRLTARERRVAEQAALGEGLKSIAVTCSLSIQAVSTYLVRAKRKLRITSRAELTRYLLAAAGSHVASESCLCSDLRFGAEVRVDDRWFRLLRGRVVQGRDLTASLTQAELEVLVAIFHGLRNAEIASARHRSVRTVTAQVSSVLRKCGAGSRAELIAAVAATIANPPADYAL
jgi:DNA-binding NarL/FixJ family response regulator